MSVAQIEAAVRALGPLCDRVVFLGGATVALWPTDPASRRPRVTEDVDVVVEVASLTEYAAFQAALRDGGFAEDVQSGSMVRWEHRESGVLLDAVPSVERLAGFSDRWLGPAVRAASTVRLPSGAEVRAVPAPWLVVLKLEAFGDRGRADCLASRDFEDIVLLLDSREELGAELAALPADAFEYAVASLREIRELPSFGYGFEGAIGGVDGRERMDVVTLPRLERLLG